MKLFVCLLACLLTHVAFSQNVITASSNTPATLYAQVNAALEVSPDDAITAFNKIVDFYKLSGQTHELPEQYFAMALMFALNGNYAESITYHKKAIRAHRRIFQTEPVEMKANLGLTYGLAGKIRKAKRLLGQDFVFPA